MELIINGTPKEIAALVVAIQERQESSNKEIGIKKIESSSLSNDSIGIRLT